MSTKKRFTIAPELASGIRNTIQSASQNHGQLHYDMMAVDAIETDPQNPRRLSISRHDVLHGLNALDPDYTTKLQELDKLNELAESIKRIGVKNAIEVYKDGLKYRIVTGERRFLASLIAGQKLVPVRVSQKPDEFNLRYTQWVENMNRQDLSLWEKFNNLLLIVQAYKKSNLDELTEHALQGLLGISSIQSYRYICLLKADEKIIQLVQVGKLNNLKLVQELVSMKDKGAKNQIISWILSSKEEVTSLTHYKLAAGKKPMKNKSKSNHAINLGKIHNPDTAKHLLEIILSDARLNQHRHAFNNIDWNSAKAITHAFKALFKTLEQSLND